MVAIVLTLAGVTFYLGQAMASPPEGAGHPSLETPAPPAPPVSTRNLLKLPCQPGVNCWQRNMNDSDDGHGHGHSHSHSHDHDHDHDHHDHHDHSHKPPNVNTNSSRNNSSDYLNFSSYFITYIYIFAVYLLTRSQ